MTTEAQKLEARKLVQARYDAKRLKRLTGVLVRLDKRELAWLDDRRLPGESRATAIKRILWCHG